MGTGFLGVIAMLLLSLHENLHLVLALLSLTAGSAGGGNSRRDHWCLCDVAQNSISHPSLAADMQSLCAFSFSVGALLGFFISGIFVHLIGPMVSLWIFFSLKLAKVARWWWIREGSGKEQIRRYCAEVEQTFDINQNSLGLLIAIAFFMEDPKHNKSELLKTSTHCIICSTFTLLVTTI